MTEGGGNAFVPQLLLSGSFLNPLGDLICRWHDECMEVFRLENDNVVVIFLALVVVIVSREKVSLLAKGTGFVSKNEMVLG